MSDTPVTLVVAVADNGVIGAGGGLPWHISSDLKTFRRLTMNKPLIMGRRTFQSLKKPLDGRDNIVVTGNKSFRPPGALVAANFETALALARRCAEARGGVAAEIMRSGVSQIVEVARHGCLGGLDALRDEQLDELRLARDLVVADQSGDGRLALHLRAHRSLPTSIRVSGA